MIDCRIRHLYAATTSYKDVAATTQTSARYVFATFMRQHLLTGMGTPIPTIANVNQVSVSVIVLIVDISAWARVEYLFR